MKSRLGYLLSCLACVYLIGGHWAVLQSVAWMGMLADYGRAYGARKAIAMTLDGNNPCRLCITIKAKKAEEQKQNFPLEKLAKEIKKASLLPTADISPVRSDGFTIAKWPSLTVYAVARSEAPPRPVPRSGLI